MQYKTKIDLRFVQLNSTFVWPLFSEDGELIIDSRVPLTKNLLREIQTRYGTTVYYIREYDTNATSTLDYSAVLDQAGAVVDEIILTQHLSHETLTQTESVINSLVDELEHRNTQIFSLLHEVDATEDHLKQHLVNTSLLMFLFAKKAGRFSKQQLRNFVFGAFLFDIGIVKIDERIRKKDSIFNDEDRQSIKRHPQLGYELLKDKSGLDPAVLQMALFHHEKANGHGYYGLPFETLPEHVKMLSICDVYDALTNDRPFRPAISPQHALKLLVNLKGSQFDEPLVDFFINKVSSHITGTHTFYQPGEMCELSTRELAVIVKSGIHDLMEPSVRIFGRLKKDEHGKARLSFSTGTIDVNLENDPTRSIMRFIINPKQVASLRKILEDKNYL